MKFPLHITFKLIAFAPRITVRDADQKTILYIEQQVMALKEAVKVYDNEHDKNLLYSMHANQIIDFGATYIFNDEKLNKEIGSVQQEGMRSLFQASYTVMNNSGKTLYQIKQTNPMIAILDSLINIIPFAELISGFILHPEYHVTKIDKNEPLLVMKKKPSLFESHFEVDTLNDSNKDALLVLLSLLMIVQLERNRG